ncbi:sigma factor-like helix-turn-helix DNA-binding protein [Streptomyces sp. TR02-1]|uniref:sigma factor-like helix-turn-helix DNA-binding protein n=1 Tax=Streptomyces sp. TR02-1 TaxID=3385977 RepID=UPI00399F4BA6
MAVLHQSHQDRLRDREFEAFVAGAGGRLLHAASLLTAEPPDAAPVAEDLLVSALARTYADWRRLRDEDPYDHARLELALLFAHRAWRYRRPRGGLLERLPPQERLVLVLRLHEGIAEEQVSAALGLPLDRVRTLCGRAVATLREVPHRNGTVAGGRAVMS